MKQQIEIISPIIARKILDKNGINRPKRLGYIKDICGIINRGEWKCTHQGIAISTNGDLIDGQHRLEGIVLSGKSVPVVVWRDVDESTFSVLDRGLIRTMSDCTGIAKRTVEVLNLLHYTTTGSAAKPTAAQIGNLYSVFGAKADELNEYAPTAARTFGSVGVRCAVVVLAMMGEARCFEIYRKMTLSEFDGLPSIINVFVKKGISGYLLKGGSSGRTQLDLFFLATFALKSTNSYKSKLPAITNDSIDAHRSQIRSFYASLTE